MEMWIPDIPYTTCSPSLPLPASPSPSHFPFIIPSYVLTFFASLFYILSTLLMLFQVFYMYSIITKNKYLSGDISCCLSCLLAVFIAYTAPLPHTPLRPLPPPDVFPCPDSLLFLLLMSFRLFLKSHSGTAGRQSSLVIHGADFSTKDMDNDNCMCKCALMLTGGKCSQSALQWG